VWSEPTDSPFIPVYTSVRRAKCSFVAVSPSERCSPLTRMDDDLGSLQPWQIFSGLYVVFWGISAYFDHFLMTFVFCIAFGVISEIVAKYMSGAYVRKNEVSSLMSMARTEATLVPSLTQMAKHEASRPQEDMVIAQASSNPSEDLWEKCEGFQDDEAVIADRDEEEEEEEECPPPLPAKDYLKTTEETIDAVKNRLSQVMEADLNIDSDNSDHDKFHTQPNVDDDLSETTTGGPLGDLEQDDNGSDDFAGFTRRQEESKVDVDSLTGSDSLVNDLNGDVLKHVSEGHCPVASNLTHQENQDKENIRSMSEIQDTPASLDKPKPMELKEDQEDSLLGALGARSTLEKEINLFSTRVQEEDMDNDQLEDEDAMAKLAADVLNSNTTAVSSSNSKTAGEEKRLYAPDSSSDDELEEEYAKREVNLDESESEEDEYEYRSGRDYHQKGGENEDDFGASAVGNAPTDGSAPASTQAQSLVNVVESLGSDGAVAAVDQFAKGDIEEIGGIEDDRTTYSTGGAVVDNKHSVGGDGGVGGGALAAKEALGGNSSHSKDDSEEIDVDLSDPQLELAATKIQSVFKGFQARKRMNKV